MFCVCAISTQNDLPVELEHVDELLRNVDEIIVHSAKGRELDSQLKRQLANLQQIEVVDLPKKTAEVVQRYICIHPVESLMLVQYRRSLATGKEDRTGFTAEVNAGRDSQYSTEIQCAD